MCASQLLSPIASSEGRSALLGGVAGAALRGDKNSSQKTGLSMRADKMRGGGFVSPVQPEKTPGP